MVFAYADQSYPYFFAVMLGLVFVGVLGIAMERTLFRPVRDNPLAGLIVSIDCC